ncbi:hypothetical protein Deipr_2633 (plasmid) [Deinococcus proteolyticus MRP]|uniref:Uncharacterized protein n=1 Tax=Deinococcus proteolyticus (strain ATCC 35074 / DSM 20540 / JCM 6276 / NBRC 101906 / NCIMB 13154 / VKM Ac-1939 / CCM 2703 / MRP) TaxID=693977 RepID=F0RR35_DEIPM|nr:hypothetical protein [Deinococcus proteolyticus]ADY27744.1 hypothetical protein Deipr_2633 [Deinococcus proteolyticus MRP]
MYYASVTSYTAGLPPGLALVDGAQVQAYIATDDQQCRFVQRALKLVENCAELTLWSADQQRALERMLNRPLKVMPTLLETQLEQLGYPSLSPAYACIRLGLDEPGEDALSQAYALKALHGHLDKLSAAAPMCAPVHSVQPAV